MHRSVVLLSVLLLPLLLFSEVKDSTVKKERRVSLTGIVLPGRSPESGVYAQGGLIGLFNTDPSDSLNRSSNIYLFGLYSQYNQWRISTGGDVFWKKEKYYLNCWYYLSYLPDKYFGIGSGVNPDSAEFIYYNVVGLQTNFYRKVKTKLFAGLGQNFEYVSAPDAPENGILQRTPVVGDHGYRASGLGPKVKYDNRDNLFSSRRGILLETGYLFFRSFIGSEYTFDNYYIDLRRFLSFRKKVWANQLYYSHAFGNVPFRLLPSVVARGYHPNLYRDNTYVSWQTEFRFPVWKWVWLTAFGGISQTASKPSELSFRTIKYNAGGGVRLRCIEKYNMFMRVEYGIGFAGSSAVYLSFYDAF